MKGALERVCKIINRIYGGAALLLLAILTIAMAVQVFTRYVLGSSMSGTEELGRYCFIWMTMLGASLCVSNNSHATVTILSDHLKGRVKAGHSLFVDILVLFCAALLFVQGMKMVSMTTRQLTPTLHIPMSIIYSSLPAGAFGILLNGVNNLLKRSGETRSADEISTGDEAGTMDGSGIVDRSGTMDGSGTVGKGEQN